MTERRDHLIEAYVDELKRMSHELTRANYKVGELKEQSDLRGHTIANQRKEIAKLVKDVEEARCMLFEKARIIERLNNDINEIAKHSNELEVQRNRAEDNLEKCDEFLRNGMYSERPYKQLELLWTKYQRLQAAMKTIEGIIAKNP
jgi:septal ring factor EnvC (AmiA/AmiB activator)